VACCAGDLVEKQSDLSGSPWTTSALCLKGLSIVRRNSEHHHFDLMGTAGVITDAAGAILSNNLYDSFGVQRFASGTAATPWRWAQAEEEGLVRAGDSDYLPGRGLHLQQRQQTPGGRDCEKEYQDCVRRAAAAHVIAVGACKSILLWAKANCPRLQPPKLMLACFAAAGAAWALCVGAALESYRRALANCDRRREECYRQQQ